MNNEAGNKAGGKGMLHLCLRFIVRTFTRFAASVVAWRFIEHSVLVFGMHV